MLEATSRLTPGCHGGSPLPVDMFDIIVHLFRFIKRDFVQVSAYLPYVILASVS
jgi:hypothetical protein